MMFVIKVMAAAAVAASVLISAPSCAPRYGGGSSVKLVRQGVLSTAASAYMAVGYMRA